MTALYIFRHGIALDRGAARVSNDRQRPLTPEGKDKVKQIAEGLRTLGVEFDLLLTSPFDRAYQTAEILAEVFKAKKKLEICDDLAVGGDPRNVIRYLQRHQPPAETAILTGHEPYLSDLISVLVSGRSGLPIALKKGGICKLSLSRLRYGQCATLEWLLAPRVILALAKGRG